jgi:hypothetical protein
VTRDEICLVLLRKPPKSLSGYPAAAYRFEPGTGTPNCSVGSNRLFLPFHTTSSSHKHSPPYDHLSRSLVLNYDANYTAPSLFSIVGHHTNETGLMWCQCFLSFYSDSLIVISFIFEAVLLEIRPSGLVN